MGPCRRVDDDESVNGPSSAPGRSVCGFLWNIKCNGALVDRLVVRVNQFNQHFVRTGRQAPQDERVTTRVRPVPRRLVDGHMNVAHARRDGQSTRAEHRAMRMFSAQYGITTTPREASGSASGASMTSFAAGSVPVSGMTWAGLHVCVALCARAVLPSQHHGGDRQHRRYVLGCMLQRDHVLAPLIRAAFDIPDHTENVARNLLDDGVGTEQAPTNTIVQ